MAFKMKGFPYKSGFKKSGFKHTEGPHEDHHTDTGTEESTSKVDNADEIMAANRQLAALRPLYHDPNSKHYKSGSMGDEIQAMKDIIAKYGGVDETIGDYQ